MIADVSAKLIGQFADCVATTLAAGSEPPAASGFVAAEAAQDAGPGAGPVGPVAATGSDSGPVAAAQPAPATIPAEAEPIDLLKLTGSTATARRLAGYGLGAVLLAVLIWLVVRRLRR
jgi:hypothetical protein